MITVRGLGDSPGKIHAAASCHRADDSDPLPPVRNTVLYSDGGFGEQGPFENVLKRPLKQLTGEHSNAPSAVLYRSFDLLVGTGTALRRLFSLVEEFGLPSCGGRGLERVSPQSQRGRSEDAAQLLLLLNHSRWSGVPLLCTSHALPYLSPLWDQRGLGCVVLCDGAGWGCALTKPLRASLHRPNLSQPNTESLGLVASGRLREWELMQEQSQNQGVGCGGVGMGCGLHIQTSPGYDIHEPFQPHQHPARPGASDLVLSATRCG